MRKLYKDIIRPHIPTKKWLYWKGKNFLSLMAGPIAMKRKIRSLNHFDRRINSQNGEDGILQAIFAKIGLTNKFCVEFGVGNGFICNTRYLIEQQGWNFLQMDCKDKLPETIKNERISVENINALFRKYDVPKSFDLLSIDIDSNDYWVWKNIQGYIPRVIVIEYNASIPPTESRSIPYDPNFVWSGTDYFGASLLALAKLGKDKGYTLIGCDSQGVNAFFVLDELVRNNFKIRDIEKIYRAPRYGEKHRGKYTGHPKDERKMVQV